MKPLHQQRVRPDAGYCHQAKMPLGPNGRRFCRQCSTEVPKGRLTFCSDKCVHEWKITSDPGYIRQEVFKRDKGVCAKCGLDCDKARREVYWRLHGTGRHGWAYEYQFTPEAQQVYREWREKLDAMPGTNAMADDHFASNKRRMWAFQGYERFAHLQSGRHWWDADHIVPVVEGGGLCGLEGYRTLCVPCHKDVTKELHARLQEKRRKQKTQETL